MLRTVVERLARGVVIKRRLPASVGGAPLYVSPDSQLKYLKPGSNAFDAGLLQLAIEHVRSDSVVWDIGANVGIFAFAAAGLARNGQVLAVEPDLWLALLLRRSQQLRHNRSLNMCVLSTAIAERNGASEFVIARRGRASNYLASAGGWTQAGGVRERVSVTTLTLDTLLDHFRPPTFVKIDVEGAEIAALRGAKALLQRVRPTLYVEVGRENSEDASRILLDAGYRLYDSSSPADDRRPLLRCVQDTLAVPE